MRGPIAFRAQLFIIRDAVQLIIQPLQPSFIVMLLGNASDLLTKRRKAKRGRSSLLTKTPSGPSVCRRKFVCLGLGSNFGHCFLLTLGLACGIGGEYRAKRCGLYYLNDWRNDCFSDGLHAVGLCPKVLEVPFANLVEGLGHPGTLHRFLAHSLAMSLTGLPEMLEHRGSLAVDDARSPWCPKFRMIACGS